MSQSNVHNSNLNNNNNLNIAINLNTKYKKLNRTNFKTISSHSSNNTSKSNNSKENIMGTMPVNNLLIKLSLPMMISMLVQALYNVVDSIFVARIHEDALTAVSMAFPIQSSLQ